MFIGKNCIQLDDLNELRELLKDANALVSINDLKINDLSIGKITWQGLMGKMIALYFSQLAKQEFKSEIIIDRIIKAVEKQMPSLVL